MSREALSQVEKALDQLTPEEQWLVLERLLQRFRPMVRQHRKPQDLYGAWRDAFPPDFDLDAELGDIRHSWEEEWQNLEP